MAAFLTTDPQLFFSKTDPEDPRLGDLVRAADPQNLPNNGAVIFGYPDDEGIRNNGGRPGANMGPTVIRKRLYRMTPSWLKPSSHTPIWDLGNLNVSHGTISSRHEAGSQLASRCLQKGLRWVSLGGGHDYGFPDGDAFLKTFQNSTPAPIVINFDAHLDVRPVKQGVINSGTPFYRLIDKFQKFDFVTIGPQTFCNSPNHYRWLQERGGHILSLPEVRSQTLPLHQWLEQELNRRGLLVKNRPCFLSVDIDALSSSVAMGCSQSWPSGLMPKEFYEMFDLLNQVFAVKALGVYEVSPPLDFDEKTSQLAAEIIHRYLYF